MSTVSELGVLAARQYLKTAMAGALPGAMPVPKPIPRPNRLRAAPGLYAGDSGLNIGLDGKPIGAASAALPTRDDLRRQSWAAESARIKKEQTPKKDWSEEVAPLQPATDQVGQGRNWH